jgi:hypothetical protein
MTQILPPLEDNLRQINMTISWFLWKGEIFQVQLSILQRTKEEGGWGMIHPAAKCMALFFHRVRGQGKKNGTVTADWIKRWRLQEQTKNPPYAGRTPTTLEYLHQYDMESAYVATRGRGESTQAYKERLYMMIHTIMRAKAGNQEMRVTKKWPHIDWARVWDNLNAAPVPGLTQTARYQVIQDIISTNERLQQIRMVQMDTCGNCKMTDMLEHRITACGVGRAIWDHSKNLIAQTLRTTPDRIPDDWLLHPQFQIRPPKCRRAILWTLAQVILFRTQQARTLTLQHFLDFLQRSRWKLTCSKNGTDSVGNYLSVMDPRMVGAPPN